MPQLLLVFVPAFYWALAILPEKPKSPPMGFLTLKPKSVLSKG